MFGCGERRGAAVSKGVDSLMQLLQLHSGVALAIDIA